MRDGRRECRTNPGLASAADPASFASVTTAHLTATVLALPEAERLALARQIIASLATETAQKAAIVEGVRRMEEIIKGQTTALGRKHGVRPWGVGHERAA